MNDDLGLLYFLFKNDFERSTRIDAIDETTLNCKGPLSLEVEYLFSENYVVRKQGNRTDTFHRKIEKPVFRMRGKIVDKPGKVDELALQIRELAYPATMVVYKQYDAASQVGLIKTDTIQ